MASAGKFIYLNQKYYSGMDPSGRGGVGVLMLVSPSAGRALDESLPHGGYVLMAQGEDNS